MATLLSGQQAKVPVKYDVPYQISKGNNYTNKPLLNYTLTQMTPRELLQVQNNEFILANPEMKAKIVAASRRGSNSKEMTVSGFTFLVFDGL